MSGLLASYPVRPGDEAVGPDGLREPWAAVLPPFDRLGAAGLAAAVAGRDAGVVAGWADGRRQLRPVPLDPVPRPLAAVEWAAVAAGVAQRHRALGALLADVYRPAGRRRGDADRLPDVVRAGVLPEWVVRDAPARRPSAVGFARPGQPRAVLAATDLVRTSTGAWVAVGDDVGVPDGTGRALAARAGLRAALPGLPGAGPAAAEDAVALLRAALEAGAPPGCAGTPRLAVLAAGEPGRSEHRLLADALGAPLVAPLDVRPRADAGVDVAVDGARLPVDVLLLRLDDLDLRTATIRTGHPLDGLLREAVRAGRLALANPPGNGVADDAAICAAVPALVRFYLGEQPLLGAVRTWVLADPRQEAEVRDRLHELVVTPLAGYGGGAAVAGPRCSAAELARLRAEVAAAPHRFVAREPVPASTVPALVDGRLRPRPAGLRVSSVADGTGVSVLPAPLTRVAGDEDVDLPGWTGQWTVKDTWLLPG